MAVVTDQSGTVGIIAELCLIDPDHIVGPVFNWDWRVKQGKKPAWRDVSDCAGQTAENPAVEFKNKQH